MGLTDGWSCRGWLVFLLVSWWVLCLFGVVRFVLFFHGLSHSLRLRTKDVKLHFCLSEWALDWLWRLMSLARYLVVSLSVMDCLYPRDPPQPVRKKKVSAKSLE